MLFAERPPGYDRVRNAEIGNKDFELDVLEEAYTTEHWLVRIYKVNLRTKLQLISVKSKKYADNFIFLSNRLKIWTTEVFRERKAQTLTVLSLTHTYISTQTHSTEHLPL